MFEIPEDLDPGLIPIAFLIGAWMGGGVGAGDVPFTQRLDIAPVPGQGVLSHVSTATGEDGRTHTELGFWRPGDALTDVEFLAVDAGGFLQVSYGAVDGYRIDLGSDAVVRTPTAVDVRAVRLLYGRVEGDLAYAIDRAGADGEWASHASARLSPV
jgi:hypothetical protein